MDTLSGKAIKVFKKEYFPKFLSTVDEAGVPNVVPVLTLKAADSSTLIFARFMIWKTAQNLVNTRKLAVACLGPGLNVWSVTGDFVEFVKQGPYLQEFNETAMFRYNAYAGVNEVGVIKVKEVLPPRPVNWIASLLSQRAVANAAQRAAIVNGSGPMPVQVVDLFGKKAVLKYISHIGPDGYPVPMPAFALFPAGHKTLVLGGAEEEGLEIGKQVAACAISRDIIAYQVKGTYAGKKNVGGADLGIIDVRDAFTASPPLPGKKIERGS